MDYMAAVLLGISLAADAMAVSVSCGMNSRSTKILPAISAALLFGVFQMVMPVLGWSIGKVGSSIISQFDNFTAFIILLFLGAKMFIDARHQDYPETAGIKQLFFLALATSIDALAAGITLPITVRASTPVYMFRTICIIGGVTLVLSLTGYIIGNKFNRASPRYAGLIGGIMLMAIAVKTLFSA